MIAEKHYDDETLIRFLDDDEAVAVDRHLAACATCSETLAHIRRTTAALKDETVWDDTPLPTTPRPETVTTLRSIATQMDAEDADADRYVALLLNGPKERWVAKLAANPQWRTPGTVRKLIAETDRLIDSKPAEVVEITTLATEIADHLDASKWYGDTVMRLRGAAWRERAYALHYVGMHVDALAAADRAASCLDHVAVSEFDEARLMLVRALVLRELERYDDALWAAKSTTRTFEQHGDEKRLMYVVGLEALVAYAARDYRRAAPLFEQSAMFAAKAGDWRTNAMLKQNMAACYRELRETALALQCFREAVELFDTLEMQVERVRATWHIGRVLLLDGRYSEAASTLRAVKDTYERLEIFDKAAIVAIDLAEAALMRSEPAEVIELCRYAMDYYERSRLSYSENAMTALGFIREAAQTGGLKQGAVDRLRSYLEILPQQPTLLFAYALE